MGAQLVQFPFMVEGETGGESGSPAGQDAVGYGAHYRLYEARDGWALLCCRERDTSRVAGALASADSSAESISSAVSRLEIEEISRRLAGIESASAVPVMRLDELRKQISIAEEAEPHARAWERGLLMVDASHPSGHRISLPFPSWYRSGQHLLTRLSPAPKPGAHTVEVLEELKFNASEIAALLGENVAAKGWTVLRDYFPSP
jgi:crotonobetainyl-CoA:carnitine CoA-transferase CaiB-like acyl-CoA transferase